MTPADAAAETLCVMPVGADAAEAACTVTRQSITHCCVLDHANDAAILTAWLANKTPENLAAWIAAPGAAAWGAYRGETMVGFALRAQATLALCYVVPIAGDCKPQDETLDVEWVDPSGDMLDTFVGQMANGYGTIVRQALAWTGK